MKSALKDAEGGHDWWHTYRVWQNAKLIARSEAADLVVVELGALLHDIADAKFHDRDESIGPAQAKEFLDAIAVDASKAQHVIEIVTHVSYRKSLTKGPKFESLELQIVRDADRLEAIGAIGIARAFSYGGYKKLPIYDPHISPERKLTKEAYESSTAPTINHFYDKLLRLKDMMQTETGKKMAVERHNFLEQYLEQFYREWPHLLPGI